jgi:hypothetical protein
MSLTIAISQCYKVSIDLVFVTVCINSSTERRLKERHLEILDWLAPCNITIAHHSAFEKREAGTGDWFLLGHHFDSWCSTDGPFLWLHGDGKNIAILKLTAMSLY